MTFNKPKLIIVWPQYRSYNKIFYEQLCSDDRFDIRVIWIRNFRDDDIPDRFFLSKFKWDIVGAESIRVQGYNLSQLGKLFRLLLRDVHNAHCILTSTQAPLHTKVAFLLSKLMNKRLFVVVEQWRDIRARSIFHKFYSWLGYFILRNCNTVFVHGKNQEEFVISKGVDRNRVVILPFLSEDLSLSSNTGERLKKSLGIRNRKVILYFGRIDPGKGLHILIKAFKSVKEKVPNSVLLICGGADRNFESYSAARIYQDECEKLAQTFHAGDVIFAGPVAPKEKKKFFSIADIFVHPHAGLGDSFDGWGLVLNEATSIGLPIIATERVGSAANLVVNGINGYITKSGKTEELSDRIVQILSDERKRVLFSQNSRKIFEDYHIPKLVRERIFSAIDDR